MLDTAIEAGTDVAFADRSHPERLGWREIVVEASGVTVVPSAADGRFRTSSPSNRLTAYPADLLEQALDDTEVAVVADPGGPTLPAFAIPDARPVAGAAEAGVPIDPPTDVPASPTTAAAVPGGVAGSELPSIFRTADLTPIVLLVSVLSAAGLGAVHALTPGHGKTLMAAYLVGSRGTPIHAAGLGLSVALSHTLGILALAGLVVGAQGVLPADLVVRTAPLVAAVSIVAIGAWMLLGEARRRRGAGATAHHHSAEPDHAAAHGHGHHHDHGPAGHHHRPSVGSTISWRSLFVLGLAGGLIPSASALLILLGSIAAGRPAFGFVLVVAFGLGMAMVMGAIGLALVLARERLDHVDASARLGRASAYLPLAASVFVLGFGLYLTVRAVTGSVAF
jgi:ABC-type nickel/cobalt efflux system permease component RcnA